MTKKIITLSVVLVVLIASGIALYFLMIAPPVEGEPEPEVVDNTVYVLGDTANTLRVTAVTVTNEHGTYSLVVNSPENVSQLVKDIRIVGMEDYPTAAVSVAGVINVCQWMPALAVVSETSENASAYGFDKPLAVMDITYLDGAKEQLTLGSAAPGNAGFYAMKKSSPAIYLVNQTLREVLLTRMLDLMDPVITEELPEEDFFGDMTLSGTVRAEPIILKRQIPNPEESKDSMELLSAHKMLAPYPADISTVPSAEILTPMFGLKASAFAGTVETEADLAQYGLAEPYSVVTTSAPNIPEFTLYASAPQEDGTVNIMKDRVGLVYKVPVQGLPWLEVQYHDLMSKFAIMPYLTRVSHVVVATANDSYRFDISGDLESGFVIKHKDTELDSKNFRQYYQNMLTALLDYLPDEPLPEDSKPVLTFTYSYSDNAPDDVLRFYDGPSRRMYISLNDQQPFLVSSAYVSKMLEDLPKVFTGEIIQPYM